MAADDRLSAGPSDVQVDLTRFVKRCVELDASDVHLSPGVPALFRVHGALMPGDGDQVLDAGQVERVAAELLRHSGTVDLDAKGAQDGAFSAAGTRYRFNIFKTLRGLGIALRRLEERFSSLRELGLPESLYQLCAQPHGLVLLAGPTGAGKSTTLAALIDRINRTRDCHIVTIEDPIEYIHEPIRALVNQRQVGAHAASFHDALVASLREDPDVILLGEVRDLDTIRTVVRAAETGHLVFSTVHAGDCAGAIERMTAVFPADEQAGIRTQLALVLRAVVAQRLLPAAPMAGARLAARRARVAASEILMNTPAVAHMIASGRTAQLATAIETGARLGMHTLEQDLERLLTERLITRDTALAHARRHELVVRVETPAPRGAGGGA